MQWIVLILIVLAIGVIAVPLMLRRLAGRGGNQEGDAAEMADQVIAQMGAFRGDDRGENTPWDGVGRLKGVEGNDGPG